MRHIVYAPKFTSQHHMSLQRKDKSVFDFAERHYFQRDERFFRSKMCNVYLQCVLCKPDIFTLKIWMHTDFFWNRIPVLMLFGTRITISEIYPSIYTAWYNGQLLSWQLYPMNASNISLAIYFLPIIPFNGQNEEQSNLFLHLV